MPHRRELAIITTAALAGLLLINAQARACDNERYPCPVVAEPQEPARATPAQPRKKAERPAKRDEKASSRTEREASRTSSHANETKSAADEENGNDLPRDAAENGPPKKRVAAGPTPALVPWWRVDRSLNDEVDRNESPVSAAAAAWLILPNPEVNADPQTTPDVTEAPATDGVRMVDPSDVNELDLAAPPAPAAPRWLYYLLAALSGAVAAGSTLRFFWPEIRKIGSKVCSWSLACLRMPEAAAKMATEKKRPEKATRDDEPLFAAEAYPRRQPQAAMPRGLFPIAGEVR
jgi:hypothetical protein